MSVVDEGLIKEMLKMSPEERLDYNTRTIRTVLELRYAVKKANTAGHRLQILEETLAQIEQMSS